MTDAYDIAIPDDYEKDGEKKTSWTTVGAAFPKDNGSLSCVVKPNISVSGNFMVFPRKDRNADSETENGDE